MPRMSVTSSRIQLLPDHLINQIAAGEVIERPASVVKELMENSLDAGATQLEIEIEKGGARLIRIRDNGGGMSRDEIPLSLCRHATSKIQTLQDLEQVASLGFRGEALASIASVSRLEICSMLAQAESAWRIEVSSEQKNAQPEPAAHPTGTSIAVRDLFYNTPARRKFLRTEQTEYQHILELVKRLALSCYGTGIRLINNQRQVLNLSPVNDESTRIVRVKKILGTAFTERAIEISAAVDGLSLAGWLGHPDTARSQSDLQYFFLNGRMVRDKRINHAIRMAFDEAIYPGRYPSYLLYLQIAAEQIDVNVHPAKSEVRFSDARRVHDFIVSALRQALAGQKTGLAVPAQHSPHPVARQSSGRPRAAASGAQKRQSSAFYAAAGAQASTQDDRLPEQVGEAPQQQEFSLGQAISCLDQHYILSAVGRQFCLINIRIANRALAADLLQRSFAQHTVRSQPLLMPLSLSLSAGQAGLLEKHRTVINALAVEFDLIGSNSLILRGMPAVLRGADMSQAAQDLLTALNDLEQGLSPEEQAGCLSKRLAQNVCSWPDEIRTREGMNALLRRIEQAGLIDRESMPGLYRYFQAQELQGFIEAND